MSAIFGALALLILFLLFALVIWRLCNGNAACAAQSAHVPTDYKMTARHDEVGAELVGYVVSGGNVTAVFYNEHGIFHFNERGEWVPFEGGR